MSEKITYTCAHCHGTFDTTVEADERAHAEARATFGQDGHAKDMAVLCDECYGECMSWLHGQPKARA